MALFRFLSSRNMTRSFDRLRDMLVGKPRQEERTRRHRKLLLDPLEERQLLSLTPADWGDVPVNESLITDLGGGTRVQESIAVDDDGDFVVAWSQYESITDPMTGLPMVNPFTGEQLSESNIYARYFTDEVQRITLPAGILQDIIPGSYASVDLQHGGNEIQKLTVFAAYEPSASGYFYSSQSSIEGQFDLWYDLDNDGTAEDVETRTIFFNETNTIETIASEIEVALQGIGGPLLDATVEGLNSREFLIHYGDSADGEDVQELQVDPLNTIWTSGFYPGVNIETLSEPVKAAGILLSPDNPTDTAFSIENSLNATSWQDRLIGPVDFPPPDRVPNGLEGPYIGDSFYYPEFAGPEPSVQVTPVYGIAGQEDGTVFDITFVGVSGKKDQPELELLGVRDEMGVDLSGTAGIGIETLKESSETFRVNPAEVDNPFTPGQDKLNQFHPSVAIDADGEFIIAWTSEVSNQDSFLSVTDVFARRFTPMGLVDPGEELYFADHDRDGIDEAPIQAIRPIVSPEGEVAVRMTLDTGGLPASGAFSLLVAGEQTDAIQFDTTDIPQVALDIEKALDVLGFEDVEVTAVPTSGSYSSPYSFLIEYDVTFAAMRLPSEVLVEYIADPVTPLAAGVTMTNLSGDLHTWLVNLDRTNAQAEPSVGMDDSGAFTIAWANGGQDLSYFNGVMVQRFERDGTRIGTVATVVQEVTSVLREPYVAGSRDGHFVVTWERTNDPAFAVPNTAIFNVFARPYDETGSPTAGILNIGGGGESSAAMDDENNFVVTWYAVNMDTNDSIGGNSSGVRAKMFDIDGNSIRGDEFRINSATGAPDTVAPLWPLEQWNPHPALDADGDLLVAYEGFTPDITEDAYVMSQWFRSLINDERNADLLPFFDPSLSSTSTAPSELPVGYVNYDPFDPFGLSYYLAFEGDTDGAIADALISAINNGATDEQVGRLGGILESVAYVMRGDAYGIQFSRFDADPLLNQRPFSALFSDSVANAMRSGHNHKEMIVLDETITGGSATMRLAHPNRTGWEDVTFNVVTYPNSTIIDTFRTGNNIEAALENATRTGIQWIDLPVTRYEGPIDVRTVDSDEISARLGTSWEVPGDYDYDPLDPFSFGTYSAEIDDYAWEVTFQGEVHDTPMILGLAPGGNNLTIAGVPEIQVLTFTTQTGGWFALQVGNTTTADILWNSANPTVMAGAIQTALRGAGFADTTVVYDPSLLNFTVTFAGASAGTDHPAIALVAAQNHPAADGHPTYAGQLGHTGYLEQKGEPGDAPPPSINTYQMGDEGIIQQNVSIGMEPDGDFTAVWTQLEEDTSGFITNVSILSRRFDELTDTAGPRLTDLFDHEGNRIDSTSEITGPAQHVIMTIDEELYDYLTHEGNAVTNPENFVLYSNGFEVNGGIANVEYGMNRAADLEGVIDPATGKLYDLDFSRPNKWQIIITLDGDELLDGAQPLTFGHFTVEAIAPDPVNGISGVTDKAGNALQHTGYLPGGGNQSIDFEVTGTTIIDNPITDGGTGSGCGCPEGGYTHPENPGAVAVDADGDSVIVFTAHDPITGLERVYFRMFDTSDQPVGLLTPVTDAADVLAGQSNASVAIDADGDFVITWTQWITLRDENGDPVIDPVNGTEMKQADIFARRFTSIGEPQTTGPLGEDPFQVNDGAEEDRFWTNVSSQTDQMWSNVAMDIDGDFVITWSSYSQVDEGSLGTGWDVYARQFDSYGFPLASPFRVNVHTEGDQQFSNVAMENLGGFVIAWTSDQHGTGDDIIARSFWSDGTPQDGPLYGEILVNENTDGDQRYPDVSITPTGDSYVVTWMSAGQDGSNYGIYARVFSRLTLSVEPTSVNFSAYIPPEGLRIPGFGGGTLIDYLGDEPREQAIVDANFLMSDINVSLDITHPHDYDLVIYIVHPEDYVYTGSRTQVPTITGNPITLARHRPQDTNGTPVPGANFRNTVFDDAAGLAIGDYPQATAPFTGDFRPEDPLAVLNGRNVTASNQPWMLVIRNLPLSTTIPYVGSLDGWALNVEKDPALSSEIRVNTTSLGNQVYPSVSMDDSGAFVVTWSGLGNQPGQEDESSYGVFHRLFDQAGGAIGTETLTNMGTENRQYLSSVDSDVDGNFVIVWTGRSNAIDPWQVYRYSSKRDMTLIDSSGPYVTDVLAPDDEGGLIRMTHGDVIDLSVATTAIPLTEFVVYFSEELSVRDLDGRPGDPGPDSVENPLNWSLERMESELQVAITYVDFSYDSTVRKWKAVVGLDGDAMANGVQPLGVGNYQLTIHDTITDDYSYDEYDPYFGTSSREGGGNALDGDFNGEAGTDPFTSGPSGYRFDFVGVDHARYGAEFRVNGPTNDPTGWDTSRLHEQVLSQTFGTGQATEQTTRSIAVDHDGDFAVTWVSYGQDDLSDPFSGGVYVRMYDRNNNPLTDEILVNTFTAGHQRNPSIAMDADGDFVVAWESQAEDYDGSWGIFGRQFNSIGVPLSDPFRVHTNVQYDQVNPAVAMDHWGNFVVTWATEGQNYSFFNDVRAQVFDYQGHRISPEVRVNTQNITGTNLLPGSNEVNPTVALSSTGEWVVAWDQIDDQRNGILTDTVIVGRRFDLTGTPLLSDTDMDGTIDPLIDTNGEFRIDIGDDSVIADGEHTVVAAGGLGTTHRVSRNPQIDMDDQGKFIVTWESFQDNDIESTPGAESYGIYYRRFDTDGAVETPDAVMQANLVITSTGVPNAVPDPVINGQFFAFDQVNPSIAMDADGDYAIVWNGNGAVPHQHDPTSEMVAEADDSGVWIRSFHAEDISQSAMEAVTTQTRVNMTQSGSQRFGSIDMEPDGDIVVAWQGNGVGDRHGIFVRRYNEPVDTAGPMVSDLLDANGNRIMDGGQITDAVTEIRVAFDEEMQATTDPNSPFWHDSVFNPNNYNLLRNGVTMADGILGIVPSHTDANGDWIPNPATNKWEVRVITDGNGASPGTPPLTSGNYEIVVDNIVRDLAGNPLGSNGLNPNGEPFIRDFYVTISEGTVEEVVNTQVSGDQFLQPKPDHVGQADAYTPMDGPGSPNGPQAVAMDASGDHVVVWTSDNATNPGIYAAMYETVWTRIGTERESATTKAGEFRVTADPTAQHASVARDADGDFVVVWEQARQENLLIGGVMQTVPNWDIYARMYDAAGRPTSDAFRVNSEWDDAQRFPAVAMDADGDFLVTWQSHDQDGSGWGIYAQRFGPDGGYMGGTNEVQTIQFLGQPTGTFQLAWDANRDGLINAITEITDVIAFTGNMDALVEDIGIALEDTFGLTTNEIELAANVDEVSIRFRGRYASQNMPLMETRNVDLPTGDPNREILITAKREGLGGEFLVNETVENNQIDPAIAMSADGDFVISWTSFGQDGDPPYDSNIYARRFPSNLVYRDFAVTNEPYNPPADLIPWGLGALPDSNYVVDPGTGFDGVVQVAFGGAFSGSGALLTSGQHVLTASHVVADFFGNAYPATILSVNFFVPTGDPLNPVNVVNIAVEEVFVHPSYNGNPFQGGDVSVLRLAEPAPFQVERYDIYRDMDELNQPHERYGYGMTGRGDFGSILLPDDQNRSGLNMYEALGNVLGVSSLLLTYDFDSGLVANDAFSQALGIDTQHAIGFGNNEFISAPGDSGGPIFIDGQIAGVVTGGISLSGAHDVIPGINSSFGDFGVDTRISAYAQWIDDISLDTGEYLVNEDGLEPALDIQGNPILDVLGNPTYNTVDNTSDDQKWSSVAMDADGDFVITWTSYGHDEIGTGYGAGVDGLNGVYARRYVALGGPGSDPFQVNTFRDRDQQHSNVAMDVDGDFVITWESFQDQSLNGEGTSFGIYAQRYARTELVDTSAYLGSNGEIGSEFQINTILDGDQRFPAVAADHTGDYVIVWQGPGANNTQEIYQSRFFQSEDTAGPVVTDVINASDGTRILQQSAIPEQDEITQLIVQFSEDLSTLGLTGGPDSILNRENWTLTLDGQVVSDGIALIDYGLDEAYEMGLVNQRSNKFEAVATLDGDPTTPGNQPMPAGYYVLTLNDRIEDLFDNPLDGDFDGATGGNYELGFYVGGSGAGGNLGTQQLVNSSVLNDQFDPAIASDADGNFVIVWTSYGSGTDVTSQTNIMGQRFDRNNRPIGPEFVVNSWEGGNQELADVAMDDYGNFVVVWSGEGVGESEGVYGRLYNSDGTPQDSDDFHINQYTENQQEDPAVAMDPNGDFVVTWTSYGQFDNFDFDKKDIYARRFDVYGRPKSNEFQVNTHFENHQRESDVAIDDQGNFVVVWNAYRHPSDNNDWGVIGQRFDSNGNKLGGEFRANSSINDKQVDPHVAMDADGDFVVAWASYHNQSNGYDVYGQRFNAAGAAQGGEFRVNESKTSDGSTTSWQYMPDVSMSDDGMFIITWTAYDQEQTFATADDDDGSVDTGVDEDLHDYGVFARIYNPDGSDYVDPVSGGKFGVDHPITGVPLNEFQINTVRALDQKHPVVAMDDDGDIAIAWVSPDFDGLGIYDRTIPLTRKNDFIGLPPTTDLVLVGTAADDEFVFTANAQVSDWLITINGVTQENLDETDTVLFDGLGGNDTLTFVGTDFAETAEMNPEYFFFETPDLFTFTAVDFETMNLDAGGGYDLVVIEDSPGDDWLIAYPQDIVISGPGYSNSAIGFEASAAYAVAGGLDTAQLYDSDGDDVFFSTPDVDKLRAEDSSYVNRMKFFESAHAISSGEGVDRVKFEDSPGDDQLVIDPIYMKMIREDKSFTRAKLFDNVSAVSIHGGNDQISITDSPGDDVLDARPNKVVFTTSTGRTYRATDFSSVYASATSGGNDRANLSDSPGDDLFDAYEKAADFSGDGFLFQIRKFEEVYASSIRGGTDTAFLHDSTGNDLFIGETNYGKLFGTNFLLQAENFDAVHAYATVGEDTAQLYGSGTADQLYSKNNFVKLSGDGFLNRAKNFDEVQTYAGAGYDTAKVIDASLADSELQAIGNFAQVAWLREFEQIERRNDPNQPNAFLDSVDKVFTAFWDE